MGKCIARSFAEANVQKLVLVDCAQDKSGISRVCHFKQSWHFSAKIDVFQLNLSKPNDQLALHDIFLSSGDSDDGRVSLIVAALRSRTVRHWLSQESLSVNIPLLGIQLNVTGNFGYVHCIVGGVTPCIECLPPALIQLETPAGMAFPSRSLHVSSTHVLAGLLLSTALSLLDATIRMRIPQHSTPCLLCYSAYSSYLAAHHLKPASNCSSKCCLRRQRSMIAASDCMEGATETSHLAIPPETAFQASSQASSVLSHSLTLPLQPVASHLQADSAHPSTPNDTLSHLPLTDHSMVEVIQTDDELEKIVRFLT